MERSARYSRAPGARIAALGLLVGALLLASCTGSGSQPKESASVSSVTPQASATMACAESVGAQLRERTLVGANRRITIAAGELPCPGVGVWAGQFTLDEDPSTDPDAVFVGGYTGAQPLSVQLPAATSSCAAAAVFFTPVSVSSSDRPAAVTAGERARADLAAWPADRTTLVPAAAILRGRTSVVLVASVSGDPADCDPGLHVSTPLAVVGDCWRALPASSPGVSPSASSSSSGAVTSTRFEKVDCSGAHTHEVYWAETLDPKRFQRETDPAATPASSWARKRADSVCGAKQDGVRLADGIERDDITLEYQWPSTLTWSATGTPDWSRAQAVCLARWKDTAPRPTRLLGN